MTKKLFAFVAFLLSTPSFAQKTRVFVSAPTDFEQALLLFDASMYGAARSAFSDFQKKWDSELANTQLIEDAIYYEALSAKMIQNPDAYRMLDDFQRYNQHNSRRHDALYHLGDSYLQEDNDTEEALKWFDAADEHFVSPGIYSHLLFKRGYCYFMEGRHNVAIAQFDKLVGFEGEYASAIKYYRAHMAYENGNLDAALASFLDLVEDRGFRAAASYYIAQIFYLQGHYNEALRYAKPLSEEGNVKAAEMTRIVADSYFCLEKYSDAVTAYSELSRLINRSLLRADYYHKGMAYFHLADFAKASESLSKVTSYDDEMAQNAYYHLGICYIKQNDKKRARTAFEAAARYGYDASIAEDAHFNKLKLSYELCFSPFEDIITSFVDFLNLYPASSHRDETYSLIGEAFVTTKQYAKALETLEKIRHKSLNIYKAMQRIAFNNGMELYTNQDIEGANRYFVYSLKYGDYDQRLKARTLYWQAECLYADNKISEARDKYLMFINAYQATELSEFAIAHYNVGYTYYNKRDYNNARRWYLRYIALSGDKSKSVLADSYNRIGDCLYVERDFIGAIENYDKALSTSQSQGDYSMLQKSICLGLQNDYQKKISLLDNLIAKYPKSVYTDNAYFEKARAYVAVGEIKEAIYNFKVVKERYPKGSLASQAMLQLGLLYYNNNEFDNSLAFYKRVINEYPSTPEALDALNGLRNVYMERGDYDGYIAYTSTLGSFAHVNLNERDSLLYVSASNHYLKSNFEEAKKGFYRYLETFPDGRYITPSNFYLADCCYADKEFDEALKLYLVVVDQPRSIFTEESLLRSGELLFRGNNFGQALTSFQRLENEAEVETNKIEAIIGQMRCLRKLGDADQCVVGADKVIVMPQASPEILREAQYLKAKSLIETNRYEAAIPILKELSNNTKSAEGAESKFLVAKYYYDSKQLDDAETEVFDYVEKGTPHQYWLAQSFILLADIYHDKGDDFQASQYLQSLKESYTADDDIAFMIDKRLTEWESVALDEKSSSMVYQY